MEKEVWIYSKKKEEYVKATRWMLFKRTIEDYLKRFKIVDTWRYKLIPHDDSKYYFKLSKKEYESAKKVYKDKGTISYEFYPCAGIGWGVKVRVLDTGEEIDITDTNNW